MISNISDKIVFSALKNIKHGRNYLTNFNGEKYTFGKVSFFQLRLKSYSQKKKNVNWWWKEKVYSTLVSSPSWLVKK